MKFYNERQERYVHFKCLLNYVKECMFFLSEIFFAQMVLLELSGLMRNIFFSIFLSFFVQNSLPKTRKAQHIKSWETVYL